MIARLHNLTRHLLWTLAVVLASGSVTVAQPFETPDASVEAGKEGLEQGYPWYDSKTDGVRRIKVKAPATPSNWNWDLSWLGPLFRVLGWSLLVLMLIALVWLIARAFLDREVSLARASAVPTESEYVADIDRVEALPFKVRSPQADLLEEARRHYLQGDFSEAIIYLFSYQLVQLDKGQLILLTRGKTNREYLREVRRRSSLGDLLEQTMVAFEDVFFGKHSLPRPRFESCWNQLDDFHRQLRTVMPT